MRSFMAAIATLGSVLLAGMVWPAIGVSASQPDWETIKAQIAADNDIVILAVFIGFQDDSTWMLPSWADSLTADMDDFFAAMTGGHKSIRTVLAKRPGPDSTKVWVTDHDRAYYMTYEQLGCTGVNAEVIPRVDSLSAGGGYFQDLGVDVLSILYSRCPGGEFFGHPDFCYGSVAFSEPVVGVPPEIYQGAMTAQHMGFSTEKDRQEVMLVHELGHTFGMPDLPNKVGGEVYYGMYSALAPGDNTGYAAGDWLVPYDAISLSLPLVGWAMRDTIREDTQDLHIKDFFGSTLDDRKVEIVVLPGTSQCFALVNYQNTTDYDAKYGGSGLLVWHMLRRTTLSGVKETAWDVELASGKLDSTGSDDPVAGEDSLEADKYYRSGSGDFFNASGNHAFGLDTNPNTNLYGDSTTYVNDQSVPTNLEIRNIKKAVNGTDMIMDIYFTPRQRLLYPNGSVEYSYGDTMHVHWEVRSAANVDSVRILIVSDSGPRHSLGSVPNDGFAVVSVEEPCGEDYRVVIESIGADEEAYPDSSDNTFTIHSPLQRLLEPNAGADSVYARGDVMTVRWDVCADAQFVDIFLTGGCTGEERVLATVENTGVDSLRVLQPVGSEYKIGVRTTVQGIAYADESDGSFRIEDPRVCGSQQQQ
jgi:hypothetical protein